MTVEQPLYFADRILELIAGQPDGCVVMFDSTEGGCGGYGRLAVDPDGVIELRMFGWPRLTPGAPDADVESIVPLARSGLRFDGTDWVWLHAYDPRLVPVAAHAAQRAIADGWHLLAGQWSEVFIKFRLLDPTEVASIAEGSLCAWCAGDCTEARPYDETEG